MASGCFATIKDHMKRNTRNAFGNPFLVWTDLAWTMGEMCLASAQVISHRTARMAAAGPTPSARDLQEFTRMGQEKSDAATESGRAMAAHLTTMNLKFGASAFRHIVSGTAALMALARSRTVGESITRHAKLAEALSRSALMASEFSDSAARLAGRGLTPIHARATANARRLSKR
jgi:hypothetical protein